MTSRTRVGALFARILILLLVIGFVVPAAAQETITYTYDALGRLVNVSHGTTGPNANASAAYTYDKAGNRTQVVVNAGSGTTITLSPTTLPNGTVGTAYTSTTITASGGSSPYTYAVSSGTLPAGLSLSSGGVLSGTPTTAGTSNFTVTATDSATHTGSQSYSVTISSTTIILSPTTLPSGTVNTAYSSTTITAIGGTSPYTYAISSGALPAGLTLSSGGTLSGTPTTAGASNFTVRATDSANRTGSQSYTVTISAVTVTLSPTSLPGDTVGTPYGQTITASGGTSPYTYAVSSGTLPAGLSLSSGGSISGTPTTAATYSFTVTATDSASHSGSRGYSITIGSGTITLSPTTLPNGTVGTLYGQAVSASGGVSPYTYAVTSGAVPAGLTFHGTGYSAGNLAGTPTAFGNNNFTVKATDSAAHTGSQAYSVTIYTTLTLSPSNLANANVGQPYSQTITASGGSGGYTYSASYGLNLLGLSLNSTTGVLSGTPNTRGSYRITISSSDSFGNTGSNTYTLQIN